MTMVGRRRELAISIGLLVLRLGAGGLLLVGHGWGKLVHFGEWASSFPNPIGVGPAWSLGLVTFAEVMCAGLTIVGFLTRASVIPIIGFLAVAGFIHHAHDPWAKREMAFIYAVPFVALLFTGAGRFSLDAWLRLPWSGNEARPSP